MCVPTPGGSCTSRCPCGEGAVCVATARVGEVCEKPCASDADCRRAEGYVCDAQWKACVFPRVTPSPRLVSCAAAPLARRTFAEVQRLTTRASGGQYQFEPSAALGIAGDVFATFTTSAGDSSFDTLAVATIHRDGRVDRDKPFATIRKNHFDPYMAASKDGTLFVVWLGFDSESAPEKRAIIGLSKSKDGAAWTPTKIANDVATDCPNEAPGCLDKPLIAIGRDRRDANNEAVYVAYDSELVERTKIVKSLDGGESFGPSVAIGSEASSAYGSLVVSESGVVHFAYAAVTGKQNWLGDAKNHIEYVRSDDGGATFSNPSIVNADGEPVPFFFSNAQVVADERRNTIYVAYPAGGPDGAWNIMLATSTDGGKRWKRTRVNDDAPCANHAVTHAVLDPTTGRVHVMWLENRTGTGAIAYASCAASAKAAGGATCSPNEAVSDAPFASYVLTRHSPKWMGEYGTLLIDVKRRALHALWSQPVDDGAGPASRIFYARGTLAK